jgi:hypothetical protein
MWIGTARFALVQLQNSFAGDASIQLGGSGRLGGTP